MLIVAQRMRCNFFLLLSNEMLFRRKDGFFKLIKPKPCKGGLNDFYCHYLDAGQSFANSWDAEMTNLLNEFACKVSKPKISI